MVSPLSALSNILSSGIATIESTYAKQGTAFPSLDEPIQPTPFDEDRELLETIDHVIAAASQLIALVKPASRTIIESCFAVSDHYADGTLQTDTDYTSFNYRQVSG
jgi:hypothetical protein